MNIDKTFDRIEKASNEYQQDISDYYSTVGGRGYDRWTDLMAWAKALIENAIYALVLADKINEGSRLSMIRKSIMIQMLKLFVKALDKDKFHKYYRKMNSEYSSILLSPKQSLKNQLPNWCCG